MSAVSPRLKAWAPKAAGVAWVMLVVVTSPVALPRSRRISSAVVSSDPPPGMAVLITPLLTFHPVAIAVAAAAESVIAELAA